MGSPPRATQRTGAPVAQVAGRRQQHTRSQPSLAKTGHSSPPSAVPSAGPSRAGSPAPRRDGEIDGSGRISGRVGPPATQRYPASRSNLPVSSAPVTERKDRPSQPTRRPTPAGSVGPSQVSGRGRPSTRRQSPGASPVNSPPMSPHLPEQGRTAHGSATPGTGIGNGDTCKRDTKLGTRGR